MQRTSSVTKVEQVLATLHARRDKERVFSSIYERDALEAARQADARHSKGQILSPLDGRIISIKDLFDICGEPTLAGSVIHKSRRPAEQDAVIVNRLRLAGAIIIGKTHMTEFAFTAVGFNPHYGVPENAVVKGAIPGGSSSGAAVSVAEGTSEIAIGSDTGGSIRIPACLNGLVGFKPTASRMSHQGVFPLAPTLDSIGPLAHTVADCIITDAIMAAERPSLPKALPIDGMRIAVPEGRLFSDTEPAILTRFNLALAELERQGAKVSTIIIDDLLEHMAEATREGSIAGIEASHIHQEWLFDDNAEVGKDLQNTLRKRSLISEEHYQKILAERHRLTLVMDQRLSDFDLMVTPTCPIFPSPIVELIDNMETYDRVETLLLRNNQIANQFNLCAITLPMNGLSKPAGFMAFARHGHDHHLLALSLTIERMFK